MKNRWVCEKMRWIILLIGLILIGLVYGGMDLIEKENYLYESFEYDLEELIEEKIIVEGNLGEIIIGGCYKEYELKEIVENLNLYKQFYGYRFDSNEEIKSLSKDLKTVDDVQKWILSFPYDEDRVENTSWQNATEILGKGKGICGDKALLACSIFYEKNIPCYVLGSRKPFHSISLINYNKAWRPILTTGVINENNIDEFMENLFFVISKNERYSR